MKTVVKTCSLAIMIMLGFSITASAQAGRKADKDTKPWRYEIEGVGIGIQGTYLVKVWSYSKKPDVALDQAKKNAVHGIVFKGFSGRPGMPGQRALANNPFVEQERADFFKKFFADRGPYMKFVYESGDGSVAAEDRMKVAKEYKIGVIVSVNVAALRQYLEDEGVIKGLASGF